jgi:taurine dioxygenase
MDSRLGEKTIEVVPTGVGLGAEICGIDVTTVDKESFKKIKKAFYEHQVLVFRNQKMTDSEMLEFSRFFGEIDLPRKTRIDKDPWISEHPEIIVVTNLKDEKGKPLGALGDGEAKWHADMTYLEEVPLASVLFAIEIPEKDEPGNNGETGFCDQYLAYETLPEDLKERIKDLRLVHDHVHNSAGEVTPNWEEQKSPLDTPGERHPITVSHHATGRKHLLLGRRPHAYIVGLSLEESEELIDRLWAHATQEKFAWHHDWKEGDLVVWDNWSTLHHRNPFNASKRRIMHRTQIKGIKPL